jgi:uncharacterized iron-regulated membrane protein
MLSFPTLKQVMKYRNILFSLHRSIGLVLGIILILLSLSGAGIVFQKELDHAIYASLWKVTPRAEQVSLDAMSTSVLTAHRKEPLWFIEVPTQPDLSYVFNQELPNKHRRQTFVNPYTGQILGSRIWEYSIIGFLFTFHHDFFAGSFGQIMVAVSGVILLVITISGILLWPNWRSLQRGFTIRWRSPLPLLSYDLHRVGGILSGVFFGITAITGIIIAAVHFLPMFNEPPDTSPLPQQPPIALSQLVQKANQAMPEGKISMIDFPENDRELLTIIKQLPNQQTGRFDLSTVELNRYSGKVIKSEKVLKADPFFQFLIVTAELHFGTFGGIPTRLLYVLIGIMPTVLFGTALGMIQRKRWLTELRQQMQQLTKYIPTLR